MTSAPGVGWLLLLFVLPSAAFTALFAIASQTGFRDESGAALGAAIFMTLATLWLFTAGLALARRRPATSLRFPGWLAVAATVIGVLVLVPTSLGNARASEMVTFAQMFLPLTVSTGLAGAGHLLYARGATGGARTLHLLAPIGVVLVFVVMGVMIATKR